MDVDSLNSLSIHSLAELFLLNGGGRAVHNVVAQHRHATSVVAHPAQRVEVPDQLRQASRRDRCVVL